MEFIDLRSDTVTKPTPEMRGVMAQAEVGDDVYGEDPTVNHLQVMAAKMLGKEAGLFIPSGTMGNLSAILAHCNRGDEVILGHLAHTFLYEAGGISALGGIHSHQVPNQPDGTLALEDIRSAIRLEDDHFPPTRLVTIENTHNRCGGVPLTVEYTQSVGDLARENGLLFHLDGARIFNAAVELNVPASDLAKPADSVTFCLSKGLAAPVGSVLCGSKEFIQKAHRIRKQLGGGMRQAGIIAAAGIVALETMIDRLAEDHARARQLAVGLFGIPGLVIKLEKVYTNMIFVELAESVPLTLPEIGARLEKKGVKISTSTGRKFRLVTHCWIDDEAVDQAVQAFSEVMAEI